MWDGRNKVVEREWFALVSDVNHKVVSRMGLEVTLQMQQHGVNVGRE
jgi:hypothetical protein